MRLIEAIAAYEHRREQAEGWSAFIRAVERVEPEFYDDLLKRWPLTSKPGKRGKRAA